MNVLKLSPGAVPQAGLVRGIWMYGWEASCRT